MSSSCGFKPCGRKENIMEDVIRSIHNEQVKLWAALQTKKGRERAGAYLVEGAHIVAEAFENSASVETVLYIEGSPAVLELEARGIGRQSGARWVSVSDAVMAKIADAQTPQGVAAIVRMPEHELSKLLAVKCGLFVAVDAVQDPGNLGTIIRSADAVGAAAVLLGKGTVDVYNPKTVRSAMGSLFHVPVANCDLSAALPLARSHGVKVFATSLGAALTCYEANYTAASCILVGNEGAGVADELIALADETVIIPIPGKAESLNVAMATTVLLYEAVRQRQYSTQNNPCPETVD
jgi:RNA methyltransferase, TrmH family